MSPTLCWLPAFVLAVQSMWTAQPGGFGHACTGERSHGFGWGALNLVFLAAIAPAMGALQILFALLARKISARRPIIGSGPAPGAWLWLLSCLAAVGSTDGIAGELDATAKRNFGL